jgi:hypothetical protein
MAPSISPEPNAAGAVRLVISYDGPSVAGGQMDVRDLAPAMLATAKLFEHTAQQMYGTTTRLKIDVQAAFRQGSFSYEVLTQAIDVGKSLLDHISVSDVIITGDMLFRLIRAARGRVPARIDRTSDAAAITFHDGSVINVNAQTVNLYVNSAIRRDAEGVVEPLKKTGIDEFRIVSPITAPLSLSKADVEFFDAPIQEPDVLHDAVSVQVVEVLAPDFKHGNKWKFSLAGAGVIWADILDKMFWGKVANHTETFGAGDALRVDLHTVVTRKPSGGLERLDEIVHVIEKIKPPDEMNFFPESAA